VRARNLIRDASESEQQVSSVLNVARARASRATEGPQIRFLRKPSSSSTRPLLSPLIMGAGPPVPPPPTPTAALASAASSAAAASAAAQRGLGKGKRTFVGVLALSALIVAGIHLNQRWEREVSVSGLTHGRASGSRARARTLR
jgi:hypothetical protein